MLDEMEIRNWRQREVERVSCVVDPVESRCYRVVVAVLDGVLND